MQVLSYRQIDLSPGITLNKESGIMQIFGTSCPENAVEFYEPVFDWFDKYIEDPLEKTILDFKMEYFNSITAKIFLMIMTKLEDIAEEGHDVKIRWYYEEEEEDIIEAGEDFESILDLEFEMIPFEDDGIDKDDAYFDDMLDDLI